MPNDLPRTPVRVVAGRKSSDGQAASTSEMARLETEVLTQKDNLNGLERLNVEGVNRAVGKTVHRPTILGIDS